MLPDESDDSYAVFCIYRDMGPKRSVAKAYHAFKQGLSTISGDDPRWEDEDVKAVVGHVGKWSSAYEWVSRAKAYDRYLDKIRRIEREEIIRAGERIILDKYEELIRLQVSNLIDLLSRGKLTQNTNMALKDLLDRVAGAPAQATGPDDDILGSGEIPKEVRHGFLDEDKAKEVAEILRSTRAFDPPEP